MPCLIHSDLLWQFKERSSDRVNVCLYCNLLCAFGCRIGGQFKWKHQLSGMDSACLLLNACNWNCSRSAQRAELRHKSCKTVGSFDFYEWTIYYYQPYIYLLNNNYYFFVYGTRCVVIAYDYLPFQSLIFLFFITFYLLIASLLYL